MAERRVFLLAEDDAGYAELMKRILAQAGYDAFHLVHVTNGEEVIAYLQGVGKYADRTQYPSPHLLLLDLKMPRVNGFEVLRWVRQESHVNGLPVVVLTSSDELRDIQLAYRMGANSFLMKPTNVHDLKELIKSLEQYWMRFNVTERK